MQDSDIKPGESVFIYVGRRGGRAAPASFVVSRVKAGVCSSDYCKQQRSLKNTAPKINLGALAQKSLALGYQFYKDGKFKEAIDAYQKSVKLKPNYQSYFGMGKANFELKQLDDAQAYEQAIKLRQVERLPKFAVPITANGSARFPLMCQKSIPAR